MVEGMDTLFKNDLIKHGALRIASQLLLCRIWELMTCSPATGILYRQVFMLYSLRRDTPISRGIREKLNGSTFVGNVNPLKRFPELTATFAPYFSDEKIQAKKKSTALVHTSAVTNNANVV